MIVVDDKGVIEVDFNLSDLISVAFSMFWVKRVILSGTRKIYGYSSLDGSWTIDFLECGPLATVGSCGKLLTCGHFRKVARIDRCLSSLIFG